MTLNTQQQQPTSTNFNSNVTKSTNAPQNVQVSQPAFSRRLFVKGLKSSTNQRDLVDYLKCFGLEREFLVELNTNKNKKHRGFAFVTVYSEEMYNKIHSQEHIIAGSKLEIKDALSKESIIEQEKQLTVIPRKIFIGGIPQNTTREELWSYFEKYGDIEDLNLTFKRENRGKGFGFLLFKDHKSMDEVLKDYQNHQINGSWFECQIAKPKFQENCEGAETENPFEEKCGLSEKAGSLNDLDFNAKKLPAKRKNTKKVTGLFEEAPLFNQAARPHPNYYPRQSNTMTFGAPMSTQVYNYSIDQDAMPFTAPNARVSRRDNRTMAPNANRNLGMMNAMNQYQNMSLADNCGENPCQPPQIGSYNNIPMYGQQTANQTEYYHPYSTPNIPAYNTYGSFNNFPAQQPQTEAPLFGNSSPLKESPKKMIRLSAEIPIPAQEVLVKRQQIDEDLAKHGDTLSYKMIEREPSPESKKATICESLKLFCFNEEEENLDSTKSNTSISEEDLSVEAQYDLKDELKQMSFISDWLLVEN
jgi:RNA recognition motif-containing protein